jgi:hypothetical protein
MSRTTVPHRTRSRRKQAARRLKAGGALALLALIFPAAALAHTGTAAVACTGADFQFTAFAAGANTVNYNVTVDGASAAHGTFILNANGGREGTLHVPLTVNDTHKVEAFAWWGPANVQDQDTRPVDSPALASQVLQCPVTPPTTTPPPTVTPPAAAVPPAVTTAPVAAPTPTNAVAGARARSASARLGVQRSCASRSARVTVSGRVLRRVTFFVNGRLVRSVTVPAGRRSITVPVPLRRSGAARQTITARVTFRNGARSRTLTAGATRCAQTAVRPQFTG